jgi:hypothetical protein
MNALRRLILISLVLLIQACSTVVSVPDVEAVSASEAKGGWARVLTRFVNENGEVDFAALAKDRADLDRYVRFVAQYDWTTSSGSVANPDIRLAHLINSYNALSMFNVIESGIPATHAGFAKLRFFVLRKFTIGGETYSLYAYENDVIRPLGDPRIHFALNCSAVSCPVLPRSPFNAETLNQQLDAETRAFFARPSNFRIDHPNKTVWLSELLDFYPEDFVPGAAKSLLAYANQYSPEPAPETYTVRFVPYDWTVANSRRKKSDP